MKSQHDSKIYKCKKCGEEIIGKGKVENHMRQHKTTACGVCWKEIPSNSWSSHKAKCTGSLLSCEKCSYTTHLKGNLKRHNSQILEPQMVNIMRLFTIHLKHLRGQKGFTCRKNWASSYIIKKK